MTCLLLATKIEKKRPSEAKGSPVQPLVKALNSNALPTFVYDK